MFKKSKSIFIFLFLIFAFGIALSLTSFSSFNSNLPVLSTSSKVRKKRQAPPSSPTEVEWNTHMVKIKPILQILAGFNKKTIIFKIGPQGAKIDYSVTNLIKAQNIDAKYSAMSPEAQTELKLLHTNGIDDAKLTTAYKTELDIFFASIKPHLGVLKDIKNTRFDGYYIDELVKNLDKKGSELTSTAKVEFIKLWANDLNAAYLSAIYKKTLDDPFLKGIKPSLQVLKAMGSTEVTTDGKDTPFQISNLIKVLETVNWETNIDASKELAALYKHNSNHSVVNKELEAAYELLLDTFLAGIKPTLKVFETMGSAAFITSNWKTNKSARTNLINLYKHNLDHSVIKKDLQDIYKLKLGPFLKSIKPALQVLRTMGNTGVTIHGFIYKISNLITILEIDDWETNTDASKELAALYKHNPNHSAAEKELQTAYKLKLKPFLKSIKPTLKVFETMGSTEVTIDRTAYKIGNLITILEIDGWETNIDASKELGYLYKYNLDTLIIISKLQTIYRTTLNPFLTGIKQTLQVLKAMGSTEVTTPGEPKPFQISNLIKVLETVNWETNTDASKELAALYKHNSNHSVVNKELEVAYELLLNTFLAGIKPALQVLKTMGSSEVIINGKSYSISNLITVLKIGNWKTNKLASAELINLYKHNPNHSVVKTKLIVAYKLKLEPFLIGIKPALQVLKAMGNFADYLLNKIKVIIGGTTYKIAYLILVLEVDYWAENIDAIKELGALYKHNSDHSVVKKELQAVYKLKLEPFLKGIKPALQVLKAMGSTGVTTETDGKDTPFQISNLIKVLETVNWETNTDASKELATLYKHNPDHSVVNKKLEVTYELHLNTFLAGIKSALQVLKTMGSSEVIINDKSYLISNLITVLKIGNWKTNKFARTELINLYKHIPNHSAAEKELQTAYKLKLGPFLKSIKPTLKVFENMGSAEITIDKTAYKIGNLITILEIDGWETNTDASKELGYLYKYNLDTLTIISKLQTIYRTTLNPFLTGIKPTLKVFETMGSAEVTIDGKDTSFQISNLIKFLETVNWETNTDASKELAALYKHNSNHPVVNKELEAAYKLELNLFLKGIKSSLQVFKAMGKTDFLIVGRGGIFQIGNLITVLDKKDWETNISASKELIALYKYNSDASIIINKLQTEYEFFLYPFLTKIKSALQVFKAMGSTEVTMDATIYPIDNLITILEIDDWKTDIDASQELGALYKYNSDAQTVVKKLEVAYKLELNLFLNGIKPALQVLKAYGTVSVKIDNVNIAFPIRNLIATFETSDWETNVSAGKELIALYKHNPDHSVVKKELQTAYKKELTSFINGIKPVLQVFKTMGSTEVTIGGVSSLFSIRNLIAVFDKNDWETDVAACKELIALYKYNSNSSIVRQELEVAYELLLDTFLAGIKPALLVLEAMGSSEVIIDGKSYSISNLITILYKNNWKTNKLAGEELVNLYKHNPNHSEVEKELQTAYKLKLGPFLKSIKPTLLVLKVMGEGSQLLIGVSIFNVGTLNNVLDKNDWETNIDASKELAVLYKYNLDHSVVDFIKMDLQATYKVKLGSFLKSIKPTLKVFETMGSTEVTIGGFIYKIGNLITILEIDDWETNTDASKELAALYKHNPNHSVVEKELQNVYKLKLGPFLKGIKPSLQVLKAMGSTEVTTDGKDTPFPIRNLIVTFETSDWETNTDASKELATLYKHNPNHSVVNKELEVAYELLLDTFLAGIKPVLQVLIAMGKTEFIIISNWKTNKSARANLIKLYKHNPDHSVVKKELQDIYKLQLEPFLKSIKPALQVFKTIGSTEVTIDRTAYKIGNLIKVLETVNWETNIDASKELGFLYKHNPDHSVVEKELQTAYKLKLGSFLKSIKPTLKVFETMTSTEITIDRTAYKIGNLITILEIDDWETNIDASKELATLYKHNSDHSVVEKELQAVYKLKLGPFLKSIKPSLQVFKTMGSAEITIDRTAYKIGNLITILEIDDWETNIDASKELAALYKHNSDHSVVKKELQAVYKLKLEPFLIGIKPTLKVFETMGSTEITIDRTAYKIGHLITILEIDDWETNIDASKELGFLYKHNPNHSVVNKELEVAYESLLDTFLAGIKSALQVLKTVRSTEVIINGKSYSISNLITVLKIGNWKTNKLARAELINLYKHNPNHSVVNKELEVAYELLLDTFLASIKPALQALKAMGSTEVTIDGIIYPISHLTTHLEITGSPQTNQAKIELVALYNYSSDIKIIKEKLDNFLTTKRKIFGINIHNVLYDFVAIGVKTISIDNKNYSIAELLKPDNIDKEYSAMSLGAQTEFTNLLADNINRNKLILIYKDKLDSFLVDIKPTLQIFAKFKVNQVKIDEKIYPIDHLLKDNNLQLIGSAQTGNAKVEFRYLIANNITKSQLDNALVEILKIQEKTKNPIQDLKFKPLIIGFSVATGILILSSIVGASVYWFLRTKNSQ